MVESRVNHQVRITVKDVAKRAAVSQATVSRVINNSPNVSEKTRQRVQAAIKELGYQPNEVARSMARARTHTLGYVLADVTNPFYAETAKWIVDEARRNGYQVILYNTEDDARLQEDAIETLIRRRVDGMLIASARWNDKTISRLLKLRYPFILLNRRSRNPQANWIVLNNRLGGFMATRHLIQLGHRVIGFIGGARFASTTRERLAGYVDALKHYNIPINKRLIYIGAFDAGHAMSAMRSLMNSRPIPTAVFAANDLLALAAMEALMAGGYRIPEDISIIGFDNINISGHQAIRLTTVSQQSEKMSRMAVRTLLEILHASKRHTPPCQIMINPELVVRSTTSKPRSHQLDPYSE